MAFKLAFKPFRLTLGRLRPTDSDLPLNLSGELVAAPEGWQLSLDATADRTSPSQVLSFWPAGFKAKARSWVEEHVLQGGISDVTFALRALPDAPLRTYLDLAFDAGEVLFNKRLPPVQAASGRLVIDGPRLGLRLEAGQLDPGQGGPIDLAGTEVVIADLRERPSTGEISLRAQGSGTAALAFVDNEAWQVLRKAGRDAAMATGRVALTGTLRLPLRPGVKLPDVDLDLTAQLDDVASDKLLPGRSLRGDGLTLRLDNETLSIAGPVTVDGVRATGSWRQPLRGGEGGTVTADVAITPQALRAFGIGLPDGMLSGSGIGKLEVVLARGTPPRFALTSDLAGLGLSIPQLGWRLAERAGGQFRIAGRATQPATIDSLSLQGGGLDAAGDLTLRPGGGLDTLRLERLRLGDWLDISARLRGRGAGLPPAVEVLGGRADMRSATLGGGGGGGSGRGGAPLSIALDRLQVSQTIALDRFAGQFDTTGGLRGAFTARVGGTAPITGEVLPQPGGRSAFRIRGEDAGDILRAAGILKRVQDGTFALDLGPVAGQPGTFDGLLTVRGTRLQGGSAITGLLDAISIVGILDQMNGPGIYFDEVEARFRLDPRRVTVSRSSAVGPSMGISLDGYYDLASGQMDMQGVLSPVYLLNGIGQIFSRRGEGLIGFNFTMTGPAASPRIAVNPLSVFTPGMFRDIFRRPPPRLSQ
nr:DUF3971 domain-containing protein [Thetidibacter halocola]